MVKYLLRFIEYSIDLVLIAVLFFDLTANYWVRAMVEGRVSYVILALFFWSLFLALMGKRKDMRLTGGVLRVLISIACFGAWAFVNFLFDSGDYASRLRIYTSLVAGCIIAAAGILRPGKFFDIRLLSGIYALMIILSAYALLFYPSYLESMNVDAPFVFYSLPGEVDKNSFAYMLLFGFLIGLYILHHIESTLPRRLMYLPQLFLVALLFNTGSRQALLMMLVFVLVYVKNIAPYLLRSRKALVRHLFFALLAVLVLSALVLSSGNARLLFYRLGFAPDEGGEYGETAQRSDELRKQVSADSLGRFLSSPITGTGPADTVIEQTQSFEVSEHNYLLHLASSEGIIGLACFIAIFFFAYRCFHRAASRCEGKTLGDVVPVAVIQSMLAIVFLSLLFSPMKNLHWIVLAWVVNFTQMPRESAPFPPPRREEAVMIGDGI